VYATHGHEENAAASLTQVRQLLSAAKAGDKANVKKCLDGGVDINCRDTEVGTPATCRCTCHSICLGSTPPQATRLSILTFPPPCPATRLDSLPACCSGRSQYIGITQLTSLPKWHPSRCAEEWWLLPSVQWAYMTHAGALLLLLQLLPTSSTWLWCRLTSCLELLLQSDRTPLHWAANSGCQEVVGLLLGAGADANATDKVSRPSPFAQYHTGCRLLPQVLGASLYGTWGGNSSTAQSAAKQQRTHSIKLQPSMAVGVRVAEWVTRELLRCGDILVPRFHTSVFPRQFSQLSFPKSGAFTKSP
jgi:hypothetical protein